MCSVASQLVATGSVSCRVPEFAGGFAGGCRSTAAEPEEAPLSRPAVLCVRGAAEWMNSSAV